MKRPLLAIGAAIVSGVLTLTSMLIVAVPAQAADATIYDRYGKKVRVPSSVAAKITAKHNLKLAALAVWLPRSHLQDASGTRKEYYIKLVKRECATYPIVGKFCWTTQDRETLLSVVDYRINSQGRQQGLVTSYCVGKVRCPSWVSRTAAPGSGFYGAEGRGGGGGGGW